MAEAVIFAAVTSAASGAVAYMGAQRQASQKRSRFQKALGKLLPMLISVL